MNLYFKIQNILIWLYDRGELKQIDSGVFFFLSRFWITLIWWLKQERQQLLLDLVELGKVQQYSSSSVSMTPLMAWWVSQPRMCFSGPRNWKNSMVSSPRWEAILLTSFWFISSFFFFQLFFKLVKYLPTHFFYKTVLSSLIKTIMWKSKLFRRK